ncbi:amidohydrolase family protein [Streptomyces viridochromogenes]|uniref:amidohydrolase family protein n=1 Tax=Streptomyces viridochromogenes TaxID=1938 RepID=UPI00069E5C33|nr:amidohydrolase family protein [Streptomyces viridochromogenes]KOG07641.1 amidohydrolase [Streptomyces viridochromogenes]KOG12782.1 amidohydrolase [Streptomyces viridochromogenes]
MTEPARIDVHQHLVPPDRSRAMADRAAALGWPAPVWDVQGAIAMMDRRSIATGLLSFPAPVAARDDPAAARTGARSVNEYTAEVVKDRPDRFGHFAALPLPDVDAALAEAAYALDELNADGLMVLSNVHGSYLGDPAFDPLWAELDSRAAVVLVHPTAPPVAPIPGLPSPLVDFPYDTARTALHLALNGVPGRYPRMKMILPHAGGFLPYAAHRFAVAARLHPDSTPEGLLSDLRRFYFDTAISAGPAALPSLLAFAAPGHVLYGSDFPMLPEEWATGFDSGLDDYPHWEPEQLHAVNRGNAEILIPRLARS